jgi:signal transduction histidine kinase/DNA-binding response OmpR family regulator/ligand-binding sensor domain-containing protein
MKPLPFSLFFTFALSCSQLFSQSNPSKILTTAEGLPSSMIIEIVQDKTGFVWIATIDGLARYDGQKFKIFRHDSNNDNSLIDNQIIGLQMAGTKLLIVTHSGNIQLFDPHTERFTTLFTAKFLQEKKATMRKCVLSADGKHLWGFVRGVRLVHYDFEQKKFTLFSEMALTGQRNMLHDFTYSDRGFIYLFTRFGLIQFNTKTYRKRTLLYPFGKEGIDDYHGGSVERANGEIVAPLKSGVFIYNPDLHQFRTVAFPPNETIDLMFTIRKLQDNVVYIGAARRLFRLHTNDKVEVVATGWKNVLRAYLLDRSGGMWLNHSKGIEKRALNASPFAGFTYQKSFKEDLINYYLNIPLTAFETFEVPFSAFETSQPPFFAGKGKLGWFMDINTISRYDFGQRKQQTKHFYCCNLALKLADSGNPWVYVNEKGLMEVDTAFQEHKVLPNSLVPPFASERGLDVADIQPVKNGIWVAAENGQGLFFYDFRQQKYTKMLQNNPKDTTTLSTNSLVCLKLDPFDPAVLWIGTAGGGLCRLDTRTLKVKRILEKDGLPNATILAIQTDSKGFLWCSTNKGLVRIHPKTVYIRSFTQADGLKDNEFGTNYSATLPDGRLAFGGETGMTIFDPLMIREEITALPVVLTSLKINNETVEPGSLESPLATSVNSLETLELAYSQNFLTFEFAGLEFVKPQQIQYRYRLLGVDENWINAGTQQTANYTQLGSGEYTFEVISTNADGVWGKIPKRLAVVIHPPWWASWWAYSMYALALGSFIYWFAGNRLNQLRQRQEMEMKRREAEQLKAVDELKTRFFSNITHEFRTPLTLILSPAEKMITEPKHDEPTRKSLFSIHRNAHQLLRLINQLLDLSKLESDGMKLSLARGKITEFVEEIVETFRGRATEKGILLNFEVEKAEADFLFDADKIEKIIYNLLSNALKFTEQGGEVNVECRVQNVEQRLETQLPFLEIRISDTGIGIPAEKLPHVFERFFQVEDARTRSYEGTGIGLSLVKELTELMGGTIRVESEVGKGTVFSVALPLAIADSTSEALPVVKYEHRFLSESQPINAEFVSQADDSKPLILVVEDNAELRDFIAENLSVDYRILTAANGRVGWEVAQKEIPDLIVSDVMMPLMDGYELCENLKQDSRTNHVAVVLLTARASQEKKVEGLSLGADDYLTKPFYPDELQLRIRNLLVRQQKLRDYYFRQFGQPEVPLEAQPIADSFVQKLYEVLEQRLDDSSFGVEELALEVGMSRRTLHRKLTATTNLTANELIRNYRLKKAATFLKSGKNASETAYLVGFESPAYFATSFKEFYQKTPSEYAFD